MLIEGCHLYELIRDFLGKMEFRDWTELTRHERFMWNNLADLINNLMRYEKGKI